MPVETGKLILVVDDEQDMRTFVGTVLETSGFLVACAGDGETALAVAEANPPHMIILDVMMPGIEQGLETYRKLRTSGRLSGVPVAMLSAIAKKTFYHMIKNLAPEGEINVAEPDAYLEKPPDAFDILSAVKTVLSPAQQ